MRALLVLLFATLALGACKDNATTQADINKSANPEGQQMKKKYEAAGKEAEERRKDP